MKNLTIVDAKAKNPSTGQFEDGVWGIVGLDGVGIRSITKTSTSGLIDTYTITYTDNNTSIFTVSNGETITNASIDGSGYLIITLNSGREVNVGKVVNQADWNQTDNSAEDFIKNKPVLYTKAEIDAMIGNINTILEEVL